MVVSYAVLCTMLVSATRVCVLKIANWMLGVHGSLAASHVAVDSQHELDVFWPIVKVKAKSVKSPTWKRKKSASHNHVLETVCYRSVGSRGLCAVNLVVLVPRLGSRKYLALLCMVARHVLKIQRLEAVC